MEQEKIIKNKYEKLSQYLNEKTRRLWCATEALSLKKNGIAIVHKATKVSRNTICAGIKEIKDKKKISINRIRKKGGGAKKIKDKHPNLVRELDALVEPTLKGDPENLLRWTSKATKKLAKELNKKGYKICANSVRTILKKDLNYSLQLNKKDKEGNSSPDRDKQFRYINKKSQDFQSKNCPVISVDTKKKELIGNFKNNGREYCKRKNPIKVNTHDFPGKEGKVAPYGVYDIGSNQGWVSVGITKDTAEFAVNTIRSWWYKMGKKRYSKAKKILINADCGGSNGYRVKLWKWELQKLSNELNIEIHISHFPPGTSKWNKIEHRMFSYISKNWRGKPLISKEAVVQLIGNTRTETGLKIESQLDLRNYEIGRKISEKQMSSINLKEYKFCGKWNYKIFPQKK